MKKKLAVKVVHYYDNKYIIKYCIYYFFPLFYYKIYSYYHSVIGFSFTLGDYKSMELMAKDLTIDEIRQMQKDGRYSYDMYIKDQKEREKRVYPYYSKRIK